MTTYSVIQKSQIDSTHRLDAEYYQPEYLEINKILQKSKIDEIVDLSSFVKKGVFDLSPDNYRDEGIPFIRVQNIRNGFLDEESLVFIPEDVHKKEKKTELNSFDLVLSKVGTIGEISITPNHFSKANFSQNVIGIKINKDKIPAGFLLIYFLSKFGQLQLTRAQMFQVQAKLELQDIRRLKVIRLGKIEEEIHQTVVEVEKLFENSKFLYSQAENLLLEELELKDFKLKDDLSCVINLSDTKTIHRLDAEYFQPKYEKILSHIQKKFKIMKLSNLVSMRKGIEIGSEAYQEEGKFFIRVSNLSKQGFTERERKYLDEVLYQKLKKDFEPKAGEILLTKDATPGIAYVLKETVEGIVASGILRLKPKEPIEIEAEYLALVIDSIVGKSQVERDTGGSVIVHWRPEQIKNCLIPILPKPTQQKIASLVKKSHEMQKRAKELLEEAKRKVEEMIEKGGI